MNIFIQMFYKNLGILNFSDLKIFLVYLGVQRAFQIWWIFHFIYLVNIYFVSNTFIYIDSKRNFQEIGTIMRVFRKPNTVRSISSVEEPNNPVFRKVSNKRINIVRNPVTLELEEM